MRILFISHDASRTGAPIVLLKLLQELKKEKDIYFELLLLKDGELKQEFEKICKVHIELFHPIGIKEKIKNFLRRILGKGIPIPSFLTDNKFDLVYANTILTLRTAVLINDMYHIPFITHLHESKSMIKAIVDDETFVKNINKSSKIITVSKRNAEQLINYFNISRSITNIVYPFSTINDNNIEKNTQIQVIKDTDFVVGLSGTATNTKGIDLLPLLIKKLKKKPTHSNIKFVWVGDFINKIDKELIMDDLNKLSLSDYFILTGTTNNPISYYNRFDIFLLLSREDSFPLVCLENASLSKPIICFDNATGFAKVIENDCGIVVPYLDLEAMCDAIYELYINKDKRISMGENAKRKIENEYNAKKSIDTIINIIKNTKV